MKYETLRNLFLTAVILVVVLLGVIAYLFLVKPSIQGFVIDKQLEARDIVILSIVQQVQQNGFLQLQTEDGSIITLVDQNLCPQIVQSAIENQAIG
jgi:hypothetical protein